MTLLAYLSSQPAVKVSLLQLLKTRQVFLKNSSATSMCPPQASIEVKEVPFVTARRHSSRLVNLFFKIYKWHLPE